MRTFPKYPSTFTPDLHTGIGIKKCRSFVLLDFSLWPRNEFFFFHRPPLLSRQRKDNWYQEDKSRPGEREIYGPAATTLSFPYFSSSSSNFLPPFLPFRLCSGQANLCGCTKAIAVNCFSWSFLPLWEATILHRNTFYD